MQRILTTAQMRFADNYTIEKLGVDKNVLVEYAGTAVVEEIKKRFKGGRVLVCIGKGSNGLDGAVIARELAKIHGFTVASINVSNGFFKIFNKKFDIIVDCIFGTGLNRNVEGKYKEAIEKINSSSSYVIACDIPSGLNGDNGKVMGVAVKANLTVAIQEFKLGHFLNDGIDCCGELVSKDIGISVWEDDCVYRTTSESVKKVFPKRNRNSHKGCYGKSVIIGGSKNYSGSVLLSKNALISLKLGTGYSTLVVPNCIFNSLIGVDPECILNYLEDDGVFLTPKLLELNKYFNADCIVIGMGVGVNRSIFEAINYILKNYKGRLIIDADGLNCLASFGVNILKEKKCEVVLTPHVAEFSRLSGYQKNEILENTIDKAKSFANEFGVTLVLKNSTTVITNGETVFINTTGTPGMAKAGSGDVLSGILCGILAGKCETLEGCVGGCYLFGLSGEICEKEQNEFTITASDIIKALPKAINSL